MLEDHRRAPLLGRHIVGDLPADEDSTRCDLLETRHHPQQRRLAAAGGPDEHHAFPVFDLEAEVVDGLGPVREDLHHMLKGDLSHNAASLPLKGCYPRRQHPLTRAKWVGRY